MESIKINVSLKSSFTSDGSKLFWHQEAMQNLRDGKGMPIVCHLLITDICQDTCSFCSVLTREGNVLPFGVIENILNGLITLGLKAVIISGGGNPLLYRCKLTGKNFNDIISMVHSKGLQIGLITNGMKLKTYPCGRVGYLNLTPENLDKITWIRVSMSGLDHDRKIVEVPDINPDKTTLGFSWIMADIYKEPLEPNHRKVSTLRDIKSPLQDGDGRTELVEDRLAWIEDQLKIYVDKYNPRYVRLLCNCLEPEKIDRRHKILSDIAKRINPTIVFSQYKPPRQPHRCYKGYPHPVINSDGWVFSCDSVVLNTAPSADAMHKFHSKWRVCRWDELLDLYKNPIRPLVENNICSGCVFSDQVDLLADVVDGMETPQPQFEPEHSAFI